MHIKIKLLNFQVLYIVRYFDVCLFDSMSSILNVKPQRVNTVKFPKHILGSNRLTKRKTNNIIPTH